MCACPVVKTTWTLGEEGGSSGISSQGKITSWRETPGDVQLTRISENINISRSSPPSRVARLSRSKLFKHWCAGGFIGKLASSLSRPRSTVRSLTIREDGRRGKGRQGKMSRSAGLARTLDAGSAPNVGERRIPRTPSRVSARAPRIPSRSLVLSSSDALSRDSPAMRSPRSTTGATTPMRTFRPRKSRRPRGMRRHQPLPKARKMLRRIAKGKIRRRGTDPRTPTRERGPNRGPPPVPTSRPTTTRPPPREGANERPPSSPTRSLSLSASRQSLWERSSDAVAPFRKRLALPLSLLQEPEASEADIGGKEH